MIPTRFWMTKGVGIADDPLSAYDAALYDAGLGNQNIVTVSSVPPPTMIDVRISEGCTEVPVETGSGIEYKQLPRSAVIFVVQAKSIGTGTRVATVSLGWHHSRSGMEEGIFAVEDNGTDSVDDSLARNTVRLQQMMKSRKVEPVMENGEPKFIHLAVEVDAGDRIGAALSLAVFDPFTFKPLSSS